MTTYLGFPGGSVVKNLPAMQEAWEMQVWSLAWEDLLEEGMATQSSILDRNIPRTEEPSGQQFIGSQRVGHGPTTDTDWLTSYGPRILPHPLINKFFHSTFKAFSSLQKISITST